MSFDFKNVKSIKGEPEADPNWDNPIKFFYKLEHPDIKDMYPTQHGILKQWYAAFKSGQEDNLISLDTGAGKTLIGLLMAESIRRCKKGKIVYLCPNNYLVAQTKEKAVEYGIPFSTYMKSEWVNRNDYLENKAICITNYASLFNSRSIFESDDIKGVVFDDAHLAIELIDSQFTITIPEAENDLRSKILDLFSNLPETQYKIESIKQGDPSIILMVPMIEWLTRVESVKNILKNNDEFISKNLPWQNLKDRLKQSICFISNNKIEISLLYPNIKDHFLLKKEVTRAYLSATMFNMDDVTRMLGVCPSMIVSEDYDYRPERLFIFSEKVNISDPDATLRNNISTIQDKSLILVPSFRDFTPYEGLDNIEFVNNPKEAEDKINDFKKAEKKSLVLANRYDGIDMKGDACRLLVVDQFPFIGNLKIRYFAEYFTKERNDFLRAYLSSKITQAFGRTLRGYDDYSVIFVLGKKLNDFLINKDNERFFRKDLIQDLEIGKNLSSKVANINELKSLCDQMLSRTSDWKEHMEHERVRIEDIDTVSEEDSKSTAEVAKCEREIVNIYYTSDYAKTVELIEKYQEKFENFSKSTLGLYLSIASICQFELGNFKEAKKYSERAHGINSLFGKLDIGSVIKQTQQANAIYEQKKETPNFKWDVSNTNFEEDLMILGELLGFKSSRPEKEKDGTLDVLWKSEDNKIIIGFPVKSNKTNACLLTDEVGQSLSHLSWMEKKYKGYTKYLFIVGELNSYHELASPTEDLLYINFNDLNIITKKLEELYKLKQIMPNSIDSEIDRLKLRPDQIFDKKKIIDLGIRSFQ